ncbi:uncharacterized protein KY384_003213 [Bacidia gigantensis]|uniref:uncharacterized protein n=1 Tax=Bacidia gigantensis TaxID=2732470 RepID=UPI001D039C74|nr:uncharacterized protein KY384_003213 [Bacidia gigantensis]KAG8531583.1 hypothetical protein KY384_003213 [Bacidia gigantensis]
MAEPAESTPQQHYGAMSDDGNDEEQSLLSSNEIQQGVESIEAISQSWSRRSLIVAYLGILLLAFATSLEVQTTSNLTVYATSAFAAHSLVSTVLVVQSIVNAVVKAPMAKFANVFGRLEAFTLSIGLYVLGYAQMAASSNVQTFASAQIFYSAGSQGLQILQQIFIADTSCLLNRALLSGLPDQPFLITVWVGPVIADTVLDKLTWRWGYAVWLIVLPIAFSPLAFSLLWNMKKANNVQLLPRGIRRQRSVLDFVRKLWLDLDVVGLVLLSASVSLILLPLTIAAKTTAKWHNASIITMLIAGVIGLLVFPLWETSAKLAPSPFLSLRLLTNRTVLAGCAIGFFYFSVFYTSVQPYFSSYLQVVHSQSVTAAGHVVNIFNFSSTITNVLIALVIKYTGHYKYFVTVGGCIYLLGVSLVKLYRSEESSIGMIIATQIAMGVGVSIVHVPTQLGIQASVAHADVAAATAIFLTSVEIGGAVGSAISGALWSSNVLSKLELYLPSRTKADAPTIFANLTIAKSYPKGSLEKLAIERSYQETMDVILAVAACLAAPIIPLSFVLKSYRLDGARKKDNVADDDNGMRDERTEHSGLLGRVKGKWIRQLLGN